MFYLYDSETKEYIGETEGQPNPLEGGFFTPPSSTTIAPPAILENQIVIYDNGWRIVADNRLEDYWYIADKSKVVFELGSEIDDITMTSSEPTNDPDEVYENGLWVVPASILTQRVIDSIESAATEWIESVYSPLKQRKLMSVAIALQDKKIDGTALTIDEEAMLQETRDVNAWIKSVRDVENAAQIALTPLEQIVFPIKP